MKVMKLVLITVVSFSITYGIVGLIYKTNKPDIPSVKDMELTINLLSEVSSNEYEVYVAVLKEKSLKKMFVVSNKTIQADSIGGAFSDELRSDQTSDTVRHFQQKNLLSSKLEAKFPTDADYKLIEPEEIDKYFNNDQPWDSFYKDFPESDGLYEFSRVGLSRDGRQALLFVSHSCGSLCGTGSYYLLTKKNGTWEIEKETQLWMS